MSHANPYRIHGGGGKASQSAVRLPVTERLSDTAEVSCRKDDGHLISRMGRGPTLSSSSGFRAYASHPPINPSINPSYDQVFCFEGKEKFLFDLRSNEISPLPSDYKFQRYGTLNAESASKP